MGGQVVTTSKGESAKPHLHLSILYWFRDKKLKFATKTTREITGLDFVPFQNGMTFLEKFKYFMFFVPIVPSKVPNSMTVSEMEGRGDG